MTPIDAAGLLAAIVGTPVIFAIYWLAVRPHTRFATPRDRRSAARAADAPLWHECRKCGRSPGPHTHPDRTAEVWR